MDKKNIGSRSITMLLCNCQPNAANKTPQHRQSTIHATNGIEYASNGIWFLHCRKS